jgi:hypothetical protein
VGGVALGGLGPVSNIDSRARTVRLTLKGYRELWVKAIPAEYIANQERIWAEFRERQEKEVA